MAGETIGFIGIGNMGRPMAANLVKAGHTVLAWDTSAQAREGFAREFGTRLPANSGDLAAASVIVTMLPTGQIVREALTADGSGSLAETMKSGSIVIDMSSSEPVGTQEMSALLKKRGIALIDAPVSGGVPRAVDGSLAIMIGGDDAASIDRAEPVLSAMGKRLFRTGKSGSGHAMKALNNLVSATQFAVASEAVIIGKRFGLDPKAMIDIMNVSTGRSFATEIPMKEHVLTGKFGTGFSVGLMAKDVKIAAGLAQAMGADVPIGHVVYDLLNSASEKIGANADHTAAYTVWEKRGAK